MQKQYNYKINVILNYVYKISVIPIALINMRLNIQYLGTEIYGVWATILSVVSWMNNGDLGISNGLRNELAAAIGRGDEDQAKKLIGSISSVMLKLSFIVTGILIIINEILIASGLISVQYRLPMLITSIFFGVNFFLGIGQSIAFSYQMSALTSMSSFISSVISLFFVFLLIHIGPAQNLVVFSILIGLAGAYANFFLLFVIYHREHITIKPIATVNFSETIKPVVNLGIKFFILQICSIVIDSTDNLIINKIFGGNLVTKYSVITKVYQTGDRLFSIVLIALWSAVTFQIAAGNIKWVKEQIKRLLLVYCVFSIGVAGISILFNPIVKIWLGRNAFYYEPRLVIVFAICELLNAFGAIYVNVANGLGHVNVQMICGIIGAVINIPLSILFATTGGMGIMGVKFATLISRMIISIFVPIEITFYLRKLDSVIK